MTAELLSVLDRLASQGIAAIPFKGPAFGARLYGDIALRTYTDLDVLIQHADLARISAVMHDAGYRLGDTLSWEISFERIGGASVDLHWAIAQPLHRFPLTADELWARRTSVDLAGTNVPTLDLEDALLVISFNGLSEDWQRVDRIADVAELVRGNATLDWPGLLERCRHKGCERIVLLGLHLARELFRVRLPDAVVFRLQMHRRALAKAGYELDDYLLFATESTDRRQGFDYWRFMLRMRERSRECIPYLQAIAYDLFRPKVDDAAWLRMSRRALFAMLRLPLLGVKRGLIALGHHDLK